MPANDALAFIIRTGTAQGRDIRTACHHLLHRNTRKFRLGQVAFKHIRRRYAAKDGSCSGDELTAGKTKAFGTLATGKTRCRQVHARPGSQHPLVKHVLPAGFHQAVQVRGTGSTALEERASTFVCARDSVVRVVRGILTDDFSRFMRRSFWHWGQICPRGPGAMNERPQRLQLTGQNEGIMRHLPERVGCRTGSSKEGQKAASCRRSASCPDVLSDCPVHSSTL